MSYRERVESYHAIEALRGRPLVAYVTSLRENASGQMAPDAIPQLIRRLSEIAPSGESGIDILIVSNGGDPIVAWRIASLLRERFGRYNVLAPYTAYSAATLLALGADEIIMHPFASLGPVDPQITSTRPNGKGGMEFSQFPFADLTHYLDFVRNTVGITDQKELARAFDLLCTSIPAQAIGYAQRSSQLTLALGERLLSSKTNPDRAQARTISESLNKAYFHHGYSLGPEEAIDLKLPVSRGETELQDLIWKVWQDFSDEMECEIPFNPVEVLLSSPQSSRLTAIQQLAMLPATIHYASVENRLGASHFKQQIEVLGVRQQDMTIGIHVNQLFQNWEQV